MTAPLSLPGAASEVPAPGSVPRVVGLDLSLSSTGVAGGTWADTIRGGTLSRDATLAEKWARLQGIRLALVGYIHNAQLVVVEGPSFGSNDPGSHERAYLWWWVAGQCITSDIPLAVVAPATLKVYATGSGRVSKEDVVQAVQKRRPDVEFRGNDQADALVLAAMGLDFLGYPPVVMPHYHRRALAAVTWPEVTL